MNEEITFLKHQISVARRELQNIRMKLEELRRLQQSSVNQILADIHNRNCNNGLDESRCPKQQEDQLGCHYERSNSHWEMKPLGFIETCFRYKNATPRQSTICLNSTARLQLGKTFFSNPSHALEGLMDYSHIWLIFIFHKNDKQSYCKGKVAPPRLDGRRLGVLSTRSPHRPNPIGLSLAKLNKIEGDVLYLSGIDLVDGTPVLDIKPYIPTYDQPCHLPTKTGSEDEAHKGSVGSSLTTKTCFSNYNNVLLTQIDESNTTDLAAADFLDGSHAGVPCSEDVTIPDWITSPPVKSLSVLWTTRASQQLHAICTNGVSSNNSRAFENGSKTMKIIADILREDPRSVYRRHCCKDQLYYFTYGILHLTCWVDDSDSSIEIVKVSQASRT